MPKWTPEREARAVYLWTKKGRSASEIASAFPGLTRNAVIGKMHRLGLRKEPPGSTWRASRAAVKKARVAKKASPTPRPRGKPSALSCKSVDELFVERVEAETEEKIEHIRVDRPGVLELTNSMCRWPIGHPENPDFHFCGDRRPFLRSPYCRKHTKLAFKMPK